MVFLKELEVEYFKCFSERQTVEFAIPNSKDNGSGLTIVVGPNNTGKTSLFEALLLCNTNLGNKRITEGERHLGHSTKIAVTNSDGEKQTVQNKDNGSFVEKIEEFKHNGLAFKIVPFERNWVDSYGSIDKRLGNYTEPSSPAGAITIEDIHLTFFRRLREILRDNTTKEKFDTLIKKIIPDFIDWTIDTNSGGDYIKYKTVQAWHRANLLGTGIISLFRICADLIDGDHILMIDEPEASLHPAAQKELYRILCEKSKDRQIILATHSPYMVSWIDVDNGVKVIRLNKGENGACRVFGFNKGQKYYRLFSQEVSRWNRPHLLDIASKEILFSDKVLFVEGQEDVGLIKRWMIKENRKLSFDIFGYGVDGSGNMDAYLEMAKDLGLRRVAALYDDGRDTREAYDRNLKNQEYAEFCFEILPTGDIRDKEYNIKCEKCEKACEKCNSDVRIEGCFKRSTDGKDMMLNSSHEGAFSKIMDRFQTFFET